MRDLLKKYPAASVGIAFMILGCAYLLFRPHPPEIVERPASVACGSMYKATKDYGYFNAGAGYVPGDILEVRGDKGKIGRMLSLATTGATSEVNPGESDAIHFSHSLSANTAADVSPDVKAKLESELSAQTLLEIGRHRMRRIDNPQAWINKSPEHSQIISSLTTHPDRRYLLVTDGIIADSLNLSLNGKEAGSGALQVLIGNYKFDVTYNCGSSVKRVSQDGRYAFIDVRELDVKNSQIGISTTDELETLAARR